jgi:hypothetical protein
MNFRPQLLFLSAGFCFVLSVPQCGAQSILNQSSEDLLKGFDVDPNQVATQYQPKPAGKAERFLQMLGAMMNKPNGGTNSGTKSGTNTGPGTNFGTTQGTNLGTIAGSKSGDNGTLRVRAPFVKLDMINGERCIRVDAPFLTYDSNPYMSAVLRNQESSAAAVPPVPISPVASVSSPPLSVSPTPPAYLPPSITPAIPDATFTAPSSIDSLPTQTSPADLLDSSGQGNGIAGNDGSGAGSTKSGRMRLDREVLPKPYRQGK